MGIMFKLDQSLEVEKRAGVMIPDPEFSNAEIGLRYSSPGISVSTNFSAN
jgi:hypothetical protein